MKHVYLAIVPLIAMLGCSAPEERHTKIHQGDATSFEKGDFVPDVQPLSPSDSTDLREMALSLPILEVTREFVYKNSKPANEASSWDLPADGAQMQVKIKRLESSSSGAQRVQMTMGPSLKDPNLMDNPKMWVSELERAEGGWKVLSAVETTWKELRAAQ